MGKSLNKSDPVNKAILKMLVGVEQPEQSLKLYRSVYDELSTWWSRHMELTATQIHWLHHLRECHLVDLWQDTNEGRNYWRVGEGMLIQVHRAPADTDQPAMIA